MTSSQKTIIEISSLKLVACHLTLYGPLTDLTPVTECGLAQCHKTFYLKCFSSWTWRVKKVWCPWILTYNKCQQIQHGS